MRTRVITDIKQESPFFLIAFLLHAVLLLFFSWFVPAVDKNISVPEAVTVYLQQQKTEEIIIEPVTEVNKPKPVQPEEPLQEKPELKEPVIEEVIAETPKKSTKPVKENPVEEPVKQEKPVQQEAPVLSEPVVKKPAGSSEQTESIKVPVIAEPEDPEFITVTDDIWNSLTASENQDSWTDTDPLKNTESQITEKPGIFTNSVKADDSWKVSESVTKAESSTRENTEKNTQNNTDNKPVKSTSQGKDGQFTYSLTMSEDSIKAGKNWGPPLYLFLPLPSVINQTQWQSLNETSRKLIKPFYEERSRYRKKTRNSTEGERPEIWLYLEKNLDPSKFTEGLSPLVISCTIPVTSGNIEGKTPGNVHITRSSGDPAVDRSLLYGFNAWKFFNQSSREVDVSLTYQF